MNVRSAQIMRITARMLVGGVFLAASASKILVMPAQDSLYFQLVGRHASFHYVFCASEFLLGIWLISGRRARHSAATAIIVLAFFLGTLTMELARKDPRPCGCGVLPGSASKTESVRRGLLAGFILNGVLLAASIGMTLGQGKNPPTKQEGVP